MQFAKPIDCQVNQNCWIVNYVDHDPSHAVHDFQCGNRSYNGHRGTDFALADHQVMEAGVSVLAAAPGRVIKVRNNMADLRYQQQPQVIDKACGNRVAIDHGNGWQTDYCHLKKGSISVKPGEHVRRQQKIGSVGLSGTTEFPHLHFSVYRHGKFVDPFNQKNPGSRQCGGEQVSYWNSKFHTELTYQATQIFATGISHQKPDLETFKIHLNRSEELSSKANVMGVWSGIFGIERGDEIILRIYQPNKALLLEHISIASKNQARSFVFAGKPRLLANWPVGSYRTEVVINKPNKQVRKLGKFVVYNP